MRKATILFLGFILSSLAACTKTTNKSAVQNTDFAELRKLRIENAVSDARKSADSKDFRLLGVRGFALEVPGVQEDNPLVIQSTYGIKIIEGTSDVVTGPEQEQLNANARTYAEKYNQTIVAEKKRASPD